MDYSVAAVASTRYSACETGVIAGFLSAWTAIFWFWADAKARLTEPVQVWTEPNTEFNQPVTPA